MIGASVGGYLIQSQLGQGGMGVVYLAQHALLGRPAAVKVLLPEFSRNVEIVNRFFNEARAATTIRHPGIVEIYDFGYLADGCAYIVMEFLDGQALQSRMAARGRMPAIETLSVARQIAGALGAAHGKGIVHRDLKPDNVFLVRDPEVPSGERIKLLDFGIAKLAGEQGMSQKTRTGSVMGTPTYMAPEQCRGVGVDHRADLYALGCIIFEMICARPPFVGEGSGDVIGAHIYIEPPVARGFAPDVPPAVEALIARLLVKDPAQRIQSAELVIAAIDEATQGAARAMGPVTQPGGHAPAVSVPTSPRLPSSPAQPPQHPTTLGAATGAMTEMVPAKKGSKLVPAVIAGVVIAGGVGAFVATRGGGSGSDNAQVAAKDPEPEPPTPEPPKPEPLKSEPPTPEPPKPEPPAPEVPADIVISIATTPPGADVIVAGKVHGTTPYQWTQYPSADTIEIILRRDGYKDRPLSLAGDHDADETITLVKKPREKSGGKTGGGSVNPF